MLFNSAIFLFIFLPSLLFLYFLIEDRLKNLTLLLFSLIFYSWGEQEIVLVMMASTIIDYINGILIDKGKRKLGLWLSIIVNLSFLGIFKYADFAFENYNSLLLSLNISNNYLLNLPNIALPIGISFYTFQTLSYTIDVYRGKVKANYNFIDFATYVTMFPQLIAGPIVRYESVHKQLKSRTITVEKFTDGVERFIIGLSKKMIIANTFAYIADEIFSYSPEILSVSTAWLGIIAYSFHIYYDFSAYSDMAIGLGKMFGFDIPENFNYPYIAKSIKEFWRRWHISLSTWFRDYLYIPLGGSRVSKPRLYFNLITVFFITGLWHGASWNFVIWGLFHGLFLIIERVGFGRILEKTWKPIAHLYTLLIVIIAWVFFRAENLNLALRYLKSMFVGNEHPKLFPDVYLNIEVWLSLFIAILFSFPTYRFIQDKMLTHKKLKSNQLFQISYAVFLIGIFLFSIALISADTYNPFIYFRF